MSYIFCKKLVFSVICKECGSNKNKKEESDKILKFLGLVKAEWVK